MDTFIPRGKFKGRVILGCFIWLLLGSVLWGIGGLKFYLTNNNHIIWFLSSNAITRYAFRNIWLNDWHVFSGIFLIPSVAISLYVSMKKTHENNNRELAGIKESKKILFFQNIYGITDFYVSGLISKGYAVIVQATPFPNPIDIVIREQPDLIIMRIINKGMDGYRATEIIKSNEATKNIPVFGFDNLSEPKDIERAKRVGMVDYWVMADHSRDDFVRKVDEILS